MAVIQEIDAKEVKKMVENFGKQIAGRKKDFIKVWGIPRGGAFVAFLLVESHWAFELAKTPEEADVIVDDVYGSGATYQKFHEQYPEKKFFFLVDKRDRQWKGQWVKFPWEGDAQTDAEDHVRRLLQFVGEDPSREGLRETPKRYVKMLKELTTKPEFKFTTFDKDGTDEMVLVTGIPFFSLCEHHIAPFFGKASVAYIPDKRIVGLSKLARAVEYHARGFQNQERITRLVAEMVEKELKPLGVAVVLKARHLCMEMRGVRKHDTWTTTSCLKGQFRDDHSCRAEFLELARKELP